MPLLRHLPLGFRQPSLVIFLFILFFPPSRLGTLTALRQRWMLQSQHRPLACKTVKHLHPPALHREGTGPASERCQPSVLSQASSPPHVLPDGPVHSDQGRMSTAAGGPPAAPSSPRPDTPLGGSTRWDLNRLLILGAAKNKLSTLFPPNPRFLANATTIHTCFLK